MDRVTKVLVVLAIVLMRFFASAEGGRAVPSKEEVDNPQSWNGGDGVGPWGGQGGPWGGHGWFPWFPHFPWGRGRIHEAEDGLKYVPKGGKWGRDVPKIDGKAGHRYP